ncbi:MAG TPA: transglutaminase domain-containing protein [Polyangiaceae bacterium]|nr:transglutaminase domain-containing protein [Polyangiaceae bacterium]
MSQPPGRVARASQPLHSWAAWRRRALALLAASSLCWGAWSTLGMREAAAEPVLHEYIDLPGQGPVEPVVTGQYPPPPSAQRSPGAGSGNSNSGGPGSGSRAADDGAAPGSLSEAGITPSSPFSIDRNTERPSHVSYEDPFTPTLVPFKRLVVYDSVSRDGELIVRDAHLGAVPVAGVLAPGDEHFYATLELELRAGVPASIPSVAPGARLVVAHQNPDARASFMMDSAENWYVRSPTTGRFQFTLQIAADRRVFGSPYRDASWAQLARDLPSLPPVVKQSALEVARALGVAESSRPREAVLHLVEHFRRFRASERKPQGYGLALYREIALTARGICRHRAYAFMITALGLGIPTRMAMNEAHAWVEVSDGELWHRIDLGGAAQELEMSDAGRPQHVQPRDPFAWPDRSESGSALAERRNAAAAPRAADGSDPAGAGAAGAGGADPAAASARPGAPAEPEDDGDPAREVLPKPGQPAADEEPLVISHVSFARGPRNAERGKALFVSGLVTAGRRSCPDMSVQVELSDAKGNLIPLGTLISDPNGNFAGRLIVPWNAGLGEHTLRARALGACERE